MLLIIVGELGYLIAQARSVERNADRRAHEQRAVSQRPDQMHAAFPSSVLDSMFADLKNADRLANHAMEVYFALTRDRPKHGTPLTEEEKQIVRRYVDESHQSLAQHDRFNRALEANIKVALGKKTIEDARADAWDVTTVGAWRHEYEKRKSIDLDKEIAAIIENLERANRQSSTSRTNSHPPYMAKTFEDLFKELLDEGWSGLVVAVEDEPTLLTPPMGPPIEIAQNPDESWNLTILQGDRRVERTHLTYAAARDLILNT